MLKLKSLNNAKGFTKEQQTQIVNELLEIINNNSNIGEIEKNIINLFNNDFKRALKEDKEYILLNLYIKGISENEAEKEITINVINSNCKFTLINDIYNLIDFLFNKMKASIISTLSENKTITSEQIREINNGLIRLTSDDFVTDGNIAIKKDLVLINTLSAEEIKDKMNRLINFDNIYKLDNYKKTVSKGNIIFYKDKSDAIILNKNYYDLIKNFKLCYIADNFYKKVVALNENNEVLAVLMPIIQKDNFITKDINVIPNETTEKTEDEKVIIKATEEEEKTTDFIHKNAVTGHIYKGNNAILLDKAMKENNYTTSEWVGSTQAKKLGKQIKKNAKAVEIKVFYEKETNNENKDFFMKVDKVYNVAELENIKKIEETSSYIEMIEELRKAG